MSATPDRPPLRLIVGLGNPGREYLDTRHNLGFMVVDRLAARENLTFQTAPQWKSQLANRGDLFYCKPLTYMNLSGQAVRSISNFYKIDPSQMLILLDDINLPTGKLRLRSEGSAGGHNGMRSLIEHIGTQAIPRIRIGVGAPLKDATEHVLGRFTLEELSILEQSIQTTLLAVDRVRTNGIEDAIKTFN